MFIRIKSRKNSSGKTLKYAYLVVSKRRKRSKKHPKQKVLAYLGRVIELKDHKQELNEPVDNVKKAILKLFEDLLMFNGFSRKSKYSFLRDNILVDLADKEVKEIDSGRNVCLKVNDGFIVGTTLKKALKYKPPEATEKEIGLDFAKMLVSVGLSPTEKTFLSLYRGVSKRFHRK